MPVLLCTLSGFQCIFRCLSNRPVLETIMIFPCKIWIKIVQTLGKPVTRAVPLVRVAEPGGRPGTGQLGGAVARGRRGTETEDGFPVCKNNDTHQQPTSPRASCFSFKLLTVQNTSVTPLAAPQLTLCPASQIHQHSPVTDRAEKRRRFHPEG